MIIGFQGVKNSNSEFATNFFINKHNFKNIKKVPLVSSKGVVKALKEGKIDLGVVAIKNNLGGIVEATREAFQDCSVQILDTTKLQIHHCLFVYDKNCVEKIDTILSHKQALLQCRDYINQKFPQIVVKEAEDTAICAYYLKNHKLSKNHAVICSKMAGEDNGLFMIDENIEDKRSITQFALIKI